jgi:hypothetical protein
MNYDWKRYWHKFGDRSRVFSEFLYVPEYSKDVFSLDSVTDIPQNSEKKKPKA